MDGRERGERHELKEMVRCAQLYYRHQRHQKEIAKELGISHSKVSRLLKRAHAEGIIRVELDLPPTPRLESALVERLRLKDAVVIPSGEESDLKNDLGAAAARYFEKVASDGIRVGLSCGFTLYHTIRHLRERRFKNLEIYPLSGEGTLKLVDLFPNTLVGMMAAKYRPHVSAYALPVQAPGPMVEVHRERARLLRNREVRAIYDRAQSVDIALVGIGSIGEDTPGFCSLAESHGIPPKKLRAFGIVGEINYQPFDRNGRIVDRRELRNLTDRVLSVSSDRLRELSRQYGRYVIAVAGGRQKSEAIRGALLGGFVNVLVTDEETALALVEGDDPRASFPEKTGKLR